jgi:hypothetical protein
MIEEAGRRGKQEFGEWKGFVPGTERATDQ